MAGSPNNFFATNITNLAAQQGPLETQKVITINPYAEGITTYMVEPLSLNNPVTIFNIVGDVATIGTNFEFYLPSTNTLLGQRVIIKNSMVYDDVLVYPGSPAVLIDEGEYASIQVFRVGTPTKLGAITLEANPTYKDSWYILNTFVQF